MFKDGTAAKLYDNTCAGVVDLHFQWMQQFGIDGVLVQRFLGALGDTTFLTVRLVYLLALGGINACLVETDKRRIGPRPRPVFG